jgi:cold shock CspA family protein
VNNLTEPVSEGDLVTYTVEKGPRGLNAVDVAKKK